MALWQFTTFTVLIAVLIVYAIIITRRLGLADARLTRMEEALLFLARSGSVNAGSAVNADAPSAQADAVISEVFERPAVRPDTLARVGLSVEPELPPGRELSREPVLPQISAKPQMSAQEEARRVYLTMRDLRARSERRPTPTSSRPAPVATPEPREAEQTAPAPTPPVVEAIPEPELSVMTLSAPEPDPSVTAPTETVDDAPPTNEPLVTATAESASPDAHDAPTTNSEPAEAPPPANSEAASLPAAATLSETAAATILETGDTPVTNTESQNSADSDRRPPDDDASGDADDEAAASKKNQEILVFLNAQRRRRRAHLGY